MSADLDPTAYDVDELRRAARGLGSAPSRDDAAGTRPSAPARAAAAEELLLAAAEGHARRPYLPALPAGFGAEATVEEFCSFLLERAGFSRAYRTLAHYHETGWLGAAAREALETRLTGLADGTDPRPAGGRLTSEDHRVSLVYVARLATVGEDGGPATDGGEPSPDSRPSPDLWSDGGVDGARTIDPETLAEWFGDGAVPVAFPGGGLADDAPSHDSGQ
ncbi:hypothetical protein N0B31_12625 [Salinirubellus salinus]|uniref:Archaeal flagella protein FlaD/E domain-containing protein n=1 Tax=Salinirubellus salinus TaxID=1364945 RepID=A0A9E7QZW5_9EURY|nr:FlaD/FlaE family flagellar protein [Salinirubellus salinus]UWM52993.1 hypothetical protein N0B31_12625 [Salinirubellus salinus]